ncbi:hypothetical protein E7T06_03020 [Deinococcus sp. Arct2-2]|uniref:hypothetical protein n=1 Tax=Deinococcus sp. Arct2-2 TaxID=2568653 RepID=UPI0010A36FBE|nr:hypothetical protein [Deinococcus sp. Arct2-2]THF71327.1 hypothetical protein E7T06_03020 [Deinococcus sp. Arct2-2]
MNGRTRSLRLWLSLLGMLALLGGLSVWGSVQQSRAAQQQATQQEKQRKADAERYHQSDPVRFQEYVRQVGIAADVLGQDERDASGPCLSVSGFESGVGDPPPETAECVIRDTGTEPPTVLLRLKDGRKFGWPAE